MAIDNNFTNTIRAILKKHFGEDSYIVYSSSLLIQYINEKTKSANRGSKSRGSFASLYSIYVIVEDYIKHDYHKSNKGKYADYEGAMFSYLLKRQRELPFGSKLQNHALNNRTNSEFEKYFPTTESLPIIRNQETNRYWINENLIVIEVNGQTYNIASAILDIINEYIKTKQDAFVRFIDQCKNLQTINSKDLEQIRTFIQGLLAPNVDARLFEIVSYSILKYYYSEQSIYWGYELADVTQESLKLFKTGRTNANDGGIDFVMKPLGRFFQVTETLDFRKYFLDIEKIEKYPVTFVIKSTESVGSIKLKLKEDAQKAYPVNSIVDKYLSCIEEIINIPVLMNYFKTIEDKGLMMDVLNEIVLQSKVEFNYIDTDKESLVKEKPRIISLTDYQNLSDNSDYIPLYTLRAACGYFIDSEKPQIEGWVDVSGCGFTPNKDRYFVVHAKGNSMLDTIKDGDFCVFEWYSGGSREGKIVLTQCSEIDEEYGSKYTVKKYHSEKAENQDGTWQHTKIELQPLNPDYQPIELDQEENYKTVGVFKCVLHI